MHLKGRATRIPDPALTAELQKIFGVELSWDATEDTGLPNALERRRQALELHQSIAGEPQPRPERTPKAVRKSRGRPRKLSWLQERQIAIFIAERQLDRRSVKNAVADACEKFGLSRAKLFRIWAAHKAGARYMALMWHKTRGKTFRPVVETKHRIRRPDFSGWGNGPY